MNIETPRKPIRSLTFGDRILFRGQVEATFDHFVGYPRDTRYGMYQYAMVRQGGALVKWSMNLAGSVEVV